MSSISQIQRILKDDFFLLNIARGKIPGMELLYKRGINLNIDTGSTPEDIWEGTGLYTGHPLPSVPAETVSIFSDDATDNLAGVGARYIQIEGLDENWNYAVENIFLHATDGTIPVTTTSLWRRVFRGFVLAAGTSGGNVGVLTCRHTVATANVFFLIQPGINSTAMTPYTVPLDKTLYLTNYQAFLARPNGVSGSGKVTFRVRAEGSVYRTLGYDSISNTAIADASGVFEVPEKADILVRCEETADNNVSVTANYAGILIDND